MADPNIKVDKFKRLAENRVNDTLKAMRLLGNLANKSNYSYEINDLKKIINALDDGMKTLKLKYKQKNDKSVKFKL